MEQREAIKSPFQMRDWRIIHLDYTNPIFAINADSIPEWEIEINKTTEYVSEQKYYTATLHMDFTATVKQEERTMILNGSMISLFTFDEEESEENNRRLNKLLQINGMTFCLGLLRNYISAQGDLLGLRTRLIFPSINLHNIRFGKRITIN